MGSWRSPWSCPMSHNLSLQLYQSWSLSLPLPLTLSPISISPHLCFWAPSVSTYLLYLPPSLSLTSFSHFYLPPSLPLGLCVYVFGCVSLSPTILAPGVPTDAESFVAVIMDNFEYLTRDSSILGPHHLDENTCVSGPSMTLQRGKQSPQNPPTTSPTFLWYWSHSLGQAPDLRLLSPWEASRDFSRISQKKRDENQYPCTS